MIPLFIYYYPTRDLSPYFKAQHKEKDEEERRRRRIYN